MSAAVIFQAAAAAPSITSVGGEQIAFWVLAPLALAGAIGMVLSKGAVHSALWLVLTMLCLGCLYMVQGAQFLGFAQIIVYTGAIMMLFLFVLMLTGREASDSVIEVLRGQKVAAVLVGVGFVGLVVAGLLRALGTSTFAGFDKAYAVRGPIGSLAAVIFTDFLFPFELTSALLITAAVGAMVLAHLEKAPGERRTQRQRVQLRMRSERMSPLPGPGVFATSSSNATPALLPDGTIAPGSVSSLVEITESQRVVRQYRSGHILAEIEGADHPVRAAQDEPDPGAPGMSGAAQEHDATAGHEGARS